MKITTVYVVLVDSDTEHYESFSKPMWVREDADSCWIGTLDPQPVSDKIGDVAAALGVDIEKLEYAGYINGGEGAFAQCNAYKMVP